MATKILIIGWDGAPYDRVKTWADNGELPTLASVVKNGCFGPLETTPLTISSCAWTTMVTGKNAGKHSIYDFFGNEFSGETYFRKPINAINRKGKAFWHILSEYGLKIGLVNVPFTYPTEKINGFMVGGMLSPSISNKRFTHPSDLLKRYPRLTDYVIDIEGAKEKDRTTFIGEINKMIEERTKLMLYLLNKYELDVFFGVYTVSDRFSHYMWHFFDANHPYRKNETNDELIKYEKSLLQLYKKLDASLNKIIKVANPADVIILSDHGFSSVYKFFHINKWLAQQGYLRFKPKKEWGFEGSKILNPKREYIYGKVDWKQTQAYSIGKRGTVYINLAGREPQGVIKEGDYENIISQLILKLKNIKDPTTNKKIIKNVLSREQIFHGKEIDNAPDLIIFFNEGYTSLGYAMELESPELFMTNDRTDVALEMGFERGNGIICFSGEQFRRGSIKNASLQDIIPSLFQTLALPISKDMDGKILDIFKYKKRMKADANTEKIGFSQEKEVITKLKKLGKI